jgi:crotonobetaine/carnitine-CoA ligase
MITDPETDDPVAPGQVGELVVRPKLPWTINSGYWGMPQATADARRNLWFHTGDALKQDTDGWFYFVDRIKDALRRRGENISSYEVEQAIQMHEAVAECAVVAIPSEYEGGEDEIKAVLVLKEPVSFEELIAWATGRMPYFIVPRYWETVEELPKTPSAKVQKGILRKAGLTSATFDREAAGITIGRRQPTSRRE